MTGMVRKATLLACGGLLAAASAMAAVPSPAQSTVPCGINLVGSTAGVADIRGQFTIVVRDLANNPIAGSSVLIDMGGCTPDIRVCSVQPVAGVVADCAAPVGEISGVTDGAGSLVMRIVGGANNTGGSPFSGYKCATVYADGVNLGTLNIGAFDHNGLGGVNPTDISIFLKDSLTPLTFEGRSDYNCSNTINPADLSILLGVSLGLASGQSCGAYCN